MFKLKNLVNQKGAAHISDKTTETKSALQIMSLSRLQKDFSEYEDVEGCVFDQVDPKNFYNYKLTISPTEKLYKGASFDFSVECPEDFPNHPPKVMCLTPIYHPNIDLDGHVCLSTLRLDKDWSPLVTLNHVVYGLYSLFLEPNPNDPLNEQAGELMKRDYNGFVEQLNKTLKGGEFFGKEFPTNLKE
ncbi:NEDD8-conjugating enzyme Ubc12, putative [Entamoeba invadens IP1]|uniref:NEDD8-conjugating enzyme Ubc12, putative n=1 Tax=Entamoeba invadens IP1 TaxID=370355 RepID=A0A0A1TVR5_ENTIV|nr:NEDD8-conjugating enzyme Ubc12, putative [Entamoeba invadens IP1]ELP84516.1 NEDD8-conjugating enzyme Ubc12, putative [Entamoeba invadens IP1]|eukprot:XP_004183862.1 NEDD8-conjugating enzyme Ubc12, putative [Entamoeba invadens IP1]